MLNTHSTEKLRENVNLTNNESDSSYYGDNNSNFLKVDEN